MMKNLLYTTLCGLAALCFTACSQDDADNDGGSYAGKSEITIQPYIGDITRAVSGMDNPVGQGDEAISGFNAREEFEENDRLTITKISRTKAPIAGFTYYNKEYYCNKDGGWMPDFDAKIKLYWTDAKEHTFIGFSMPQVESGTYQFAPEDGKTNNATNGLVPYYGTLPTEQTDAKKLKEADLLLTYDDALAADLHNDMVAAQLYMHHAMAKVKMILNINGFAYNKDAAEDIRTDVNNIQLTDQPTEFVWDQKSYNVVEKESSTTAAVKAWKAVVSGTENNKQFLAYALVVPGKRNFKLRLSVTYNDIANPNPDGTYPQKTQYYDAVFNDIEFIGGKRTTLHVTLTHLNEAMIVKATYNDWEDVNLEDRTNLQKNSIFLKSLDESGIKLGSDEGNNNIEKADWLYNTIVDGEKVVKDCYGNDGSEEHPYIIKFANQLLAFKKEVESGNSFTGKHVKLDTDIYLQADNKSEEISWSGIGRGSNIFNGHFEGLHASVSSLKGNPLFNEIGTQASITHLTIRTFNARKLSETGVAEGAILCGINNGTIMGCPTYGTVKGDVAGGVVKTNNGNIYACFHQGDVIATTKAGGITADNYGNIARCYQANGNVSATTCGGVCASNNSSVTYAYYDTFCAPGISAIASTADTETCKGYTIDEMKRITFSNTLNTGIESVNEIDVQYTQSAGEYPDIEWKR